MSGTLYFGDNKHILENYIQNEIVDLIYLDPPFNSDANYNILYKEKTGEESVSQITAFEDTWHWDDAAVNTYDEIMSSAKIGPDVKTAVEAMVKLLRKSDIAAYLVMMTPRLVELHRVLKPTGAIFLHCDWHVNSYLRVIMDRIFSPSNFRNEIYVKRTTKNVHEREEVNKLNVTYDSVLFYAKSKSHKIRVPMKEEKKPERWLGFEANEFRTGMDYELFGFKPNEGHHWRWTKERAEQAIKDGILRPNPKTGKPEYLIPASTETIVGSAWDDIPAYSFKSGYPTEKSPALLERILEMSSKPGDTVLDPFCGCGTSIYAAQKLNRPWVGIDITHLAIRVIKTRLFGAFPGINVKIVGEPTDLEGARELATQDRYQFQFWALSLLKGAQAVNDGKKGRDRGIDGVVFSSMKGTRLYRGLVQVKSGHVSSAYVRDLNGKVSTEKADFGIFLTLEPPTRDMHQEALDAGSFTSDWGEKVPKMQILTIGELLDGKQPIYPYPISSEEKRVPKEKKGHGKDSSFQKTLT